MSNSKKHSESKIDRRRFLRGAGLGAGALGVTAAVLASSKPAEASEAGLQDKSGGGYRETDHVRRAYEVARF